MNKHTRTTGKVILANAERLLHAYARGARIQSLWKSDWVTENEGRVPTTDSRDVQLTWRVHPKDAHLEWGLVSTQLLRLVREGLKDDWSETEPLDPFRDLALGLFGRAMRWYMESTPRAKFDDGYTFARHHMQLLAEFYADQGA
jgi:hypothetical protein